jgi:hypothetical protein
VWGEVDGQACVSFIQVRNFILDLVNTIGRLFKLNLKLGKYAYGFILGIIEPEEFSSVW